MLSIPLYNSFKLSMQVAEMKKELVDLQPKLEQAKIDNTKMMKVNTFHSLCIYTSMYKYTELMNVMIFR